MIYITLDTCVWLNLIKENINSKDNLFEELCYWIENNHITNIVPDNIIKEWNRNIMKEYTNVIIQKKQINDNLKPPPFSPEEVSNIIEKRITRIEKIFKNSIIAKKNDDIIKNASERTLSRQAPSHMKDSFSDAVNILTLNYYINENEISDCYFSSSNYKDFSIPNDIPEKFHPDLQKLAPNLVYIYYKNDAKKRTDNFYQLRGILPDFLKYLNEQEELKTKNEREQKLQQVLEIINPDHDFLENTKYIDLAIGKSTITKFDHDIIHLLIEGHCSFKKYFFNNVSDAKWFNFIEEKGYFKAENNLDPIEIEKNRFQIPLWEPLLYLNKLSLQIKEKSDNKLTKKIIDIITEVSKHPKDNNTTWYWFLEIINNLPNEEIDIELCDFIPTWLAGKFGSSAQTSVICTQLLPKFLKGSPSKHDIGIAERILTCLFEVNVRDADNLDRIDNIFYSNAHINILSQVLNGGMVSQIVSHCSNDIFTYLELQISKLMILRPKIIFKIPYSGGVYEASASINDGELIVRLEGKPDLIIDLKTENDIDLMDHIKNNFNNQGIKTDPTNKYESLEYYIFNDMVFDTPIHKLNGVYYNEDKIFEVFTLIYRDLLNEKIKQSLPEDAIIILKNIFESNSLRSPFFKRSVIYVIANNWKKTKSLFWELVKEQDHLYFLFSKHKYMRDLFWLLQENRLALTQDEILTLQAIIDQGPLDEKNENFKYYSERWQIQWCSVLKDFEPFEKKYAEISVLLKNDYDYLEDIDGSRKLVGKAVEPIFSVEQILAMSNKDILNKIQELHSCKNFDTLPYVLSCAVEINPQKFVDDIDLYMKVDNIFIERIVWSLSNAWLNKRDYDWAKLLTFMDSYIKQVSLIENINIFQSLSHLLVEGMRDDKHAFDPELLPVVKEIIIFMVTNLRSTDEPPVDINPDMSQISNTVDHAVLTALLKYSLRKARVSDLNNTEEKWELDIRVLYESILKKKNLNGYVLEAEYFQQLFYLNSHWLKEQYKNNLNLKGNEWEYFICGFQNYNLWNNKECYTTVLPIFKRAIRNNIDKEYFKNIIRNFALFYLWGHDTLENNGLVVQLIASSKSESIIKLIQELSRHYRVGLQFEDKERIQTLIYKFWRYVLDKDLGDNTAEKSEVLRALLFFISYITELDHETTKLIIESCRFTNDEHFKFHILIDNLQRIKTIETAEHIGKILWDSIHSFNAISIQKEGLLSELIVFLYENNQKDFANKICNMISKVGHSFLKEIYEQYNA